MITMMMMVMMMMMMMMMYLSGYLVRSSAVLSILSTERGRDTEENGLGQTLTLQSNDFAPVLEKLNAGLVMGIFKICCRILFKWMGSKHQTKSCLKLDKYIYSILCKVQSVPCESVRVG